ncbi:histidine--tRNA ligase [Lentilitoribacter sp. Alg239-R112]|uniref:histidine--tRNA ligase n=1 Tax=Lentilitoribacter sp. Alg239-R112 TaxID=2305987 RepID=UPI0013A6F05B|nr:histidine--tRNA ligase [Lentilitoribacter sp. Alg239-R112]
MAKKNKKAPKLRARLPRGFPDRTPFDIRATEEMLGKIKTVYERFGFEPVETPMFEYTDALGKFLPDTDRPNAGVFSLQDDDDQWMSLRYDLTAPLARHVAENFNEIQLPYRTYRSGWVFRNEKPGPGRFRQFMQFDADIVGAPGVQADAEMCMMMADTMEALGIKRGQYVIRVNNRKILDGLMEAIGLSDEHNNDRRLNVMRSMDKLDKFGVEGVKLLLGKGRWDGGSEGEGDFAEGAELESTSIDAVLEILTSNNLDDLVDVGENGLEFKTPALAQLESNATFEAGFQELGAISTIVNSSGYDVDRISIDPSVVRGLEYYTGPVYEAELLFDVVNEKGQKVQFGSVGGGGRYDGLVSRFMGQPVPATGFSIGVSRLMTALKNLKKIGGEQDVGPVLITVMDKKMLADYAKIANDLRKALNPLGDDGQPIGPVIPVELYQGNPKNFGNQLKYADRRNAPIAIIQGSDEKENGEVQIKDLIEGKRISENIEDNAEWRAMRPAQVSVPVDQIAEKVKEILAAQQADREALDSGS